MIKYGKIYGIIKSGEKERTRIKTFPMQLCPPQIPDVQAMNGTQSPKWSQASH
jgi:hypothetical protein